MNNKCAAQHIGPWAIEPRWFSAAVAAVKAGTWPMAAAADSESGGNGYEVTPDGIAIVPIMGQITKAESSFGGASSVRIRRSIREAVNDSNVRALVLRIDSPGGTVSGVPELAAEVRAADSKKPVYAYGEDLMASAALWVASQARLVGLNATGEAGSIGVVSVVEDSSGRYERLGIEVHVVSTGPYKGAFAEGAPVSDEQLEYLQEVVDDLNEHFMQAVADGRKMGMDDVRAIADGRTWIGVKAKAKGLVDVVEPFDEFMARVAREAAPRGRSVEVARRRIGI